MGALVFVLFIAMDILPIGSGGAKLYCLWCFWSVPQSSFWAIFFYRFVSRVSLLFRFQ